MSDPAVLPAPRWRGWPPLFLLAALVVGVRNLTDLSGSPPGLYTDEASIGYNAWAIAHHGVDEHGAGFPLFFRAFGEYKNPVYIYVLAPFVRVLGLTPAVVRLPAAIFGVITALAMAGLAQKVSGSRLIALASLLLAGATPWLVLESRVAFEVVSMVASLAVMLWCLAHIRGEPGDRRWYLAAGIAAGLAVFAYSAGRLEVAVLTAASLICFGRNRQELRRWLWMAAPVSVAYLSLGVWALEHPGALTARLGQISIGFDHPSLPALVGRFIANMVSHYSPAFLFVFGDANPRHNTGFLGMLLVTSLPLFAIGVVTCARRFHEALPRFVLLGLLLGPVAASLTEEGVPHALRDAPSLPFLLATLAYGMVGLRRLLGRRRLVLAVPLMVAILVETVAYNVDLFGGYPARSALVFDAPQIAAIDRAHREADGHVVWLSRGLDQPYIQAAFLTLPPPPGHDAGDASVGIELAERGFQDVTDLNRLAVAAQPGDLLILAAAESPPANVTPLFVESALTGRPGPHGIDTVMAVAVRVYRFS